MITITKGIAYVGQAMLRELLRQSHRHLPRPGNIAAALFRMHVRDLDLVEFRNRLLDVVYGNLPVLDR
jgi:hypothetical protein